jgi:hypothetical protein
VTFEERLDKLTERHEALTQTVGIIAGMQRENEKMIGQLGRFIDSLARIAEVHERRIEGLEEGNEQ